MSIDPVSRRTFLAMSAAAAPLASMAATPSSIPVGLELYSVRDVIIPDILCTLKALRKMGYQVVEFWSPYYSWSETVAKTVRARLDDLGMKCMSTHNDSGTFTPGSIQKAIDLNHILGSKFVVMASAGTVKGLDGWKAIADRLTTSAEKLKTAGMRGGYHNHKPEFLPVEGKRPIEVIAANTPQDFMLQLDIGTCMEAEGDPVAWIKANPGRINCIHCKDWAPGPDKGYKVLFGEGVSPWPAIFEAAESVGGIEYYLIEQEGSRFPAMEAVKRCLANWKKMRSKH